MSEQPTRDAYFHDPFHDPSSFLSFTEYLQGSTTTDYDTLATAFGLSPSTRQTFFTTTTNSDQKPKTETGDQTPVTPNSSVFSSSTEGAGDDEDHGNNNSSKKDKQQLSKGTGEEGGVETSKKV